MSFDAGVWITAWFGEDCMMFCWHLVKIGLNVLAELTNESEVRMTADQSQALLAPILQNWWLLTELTNVFFENLKVDWFSILSIKMQQFIIRIYCRLGFCSYFRVKYPSNLHILVSLLSFVLYGPLDTRSSPSEDWSPILLKLIHFLKFLILKINDTGLI